MTSVSPPFFVSLMNHTSKYSYRDYSSFIYKSCFRWQYTTGLALNGRRDMCEYKSERKRDPTSSQFPRVLFPYHIPMRSHSHAITLPCLHIPMHTTRPSPYLSHLPPIHHLVLKLSHVVRMPSQHVLNSSPALPANISKSNSKEGEKQRYKKRIFHFKIYK